MKKDKGSSDTDPENWTCTGCNHENETDSLNCSKCDAKKETSRKVILKRNPIRSETEVQSQNPTTADAEASNSSRTAASDSSASDSSKTKDTSSMFSPLRFCILVALIAACVASQYDISGVFKSTPDVQNKNETAEEKNNKFLEEMSSIIGMLKNTESNLRHVNRTLTLHIKEDRPERPAIILLLGTNTSTCPLCICTWRFVEALREYYSEEGPSIDSGHIPASAFGERDDNEGKVHIEESIKSVVDADNHLVVMDDVDKYPVSSLSKVHSYVDNENPVHGNVVYILTSVIPMEPDLKVEKSQDLRKIARDHFDDRWSQYDKDHRRALMSRMTSVIGLIHKGHSEEDWTESESVGESIRDKCKNKCGY